MARQRSANAAAAVAASLGALALGAAAAWPQATKPMRGAPGVPHAELRPLGAREQAFLPTGPDRATPALERTEGFAGSSAPAGLAQAQPPEPDPPPTDTPTDDESLGVPGQDEGQDQDESEFEEEFDIDIPEERNRRRRREQRRREPEIGGLEPAPAAEPPAVRRFRRFHRRPRGTGLPRTGADPAPLTVSGLFLLSLGGMFRLLGSPRPRR